MVRTYGSNPEIARLATPSALRGLKGGQDKRGVAAAEAEADYTISLVARVRGVIFHLLCLLVLLLPPTFQ